MSKSEVKVKIGVDIALAGKDRTEKLYIIGKKKMKEFDAYKATGLTPGQIQEVDKLYYEKCRELAKLKANMPPCEIGDKIWELYKGKIRVNTVIGLELNRRREWYILMEADKTLGTIVRPETEIGETIFLLPAEAQKALERWKVKNV